jgi:hypothetical protein
MDNLLRASAPPREISFFGSPDGAETRRISDTRHAELISSCSGFVRASTALHGPPVAAKKWTLNQVQGDGIAFAS